MEYIRVAEGVILLWIFGFCKRCTFSW